MTRVKKTMAWGLVFGGKILKMTYDTRSEARLVSKPHCKVIRVSITEVKARKR